MMRQDNEEKQLLEDASTLLMFANVAARQQGPPSPLQSKPQVQPHNLALEVISNIKPFSSDTKPPYNQPPPTEALPSMGPAPPQAFPVPATKMSPQIMSVPHLAQSHSPLPPHTTLPHIMPSYNYFPYGYNANGPAHIPQNADRLSASAPPPKLQPLLSSPHLSTREHLKTEPPSHRTQTSTSSKLPEPSGLQTSISALSVLPAQGKFQTHCRTPSGDHYPAHLASPHAISPGPANVALNRGINVETGKRNNNNAVIAAAALAVAAENPLPLKSIDPTRPPLPKKEQLVLDSALTETEDDLNKTDEELSQNDKGTLPPKQSSRIDSKSSNSALEIAPLAVKQQPMLVPPIFRPESSNSVEIQPKDEPLSPGPNPTREVEDKSTEESLLPDVPALESYKVHPDSGVIGCICAIEEDDGFTIQCDVCYRWQHCMCMGYKTNEEVPEDEYKCYLCDESKRNKFDSSVCKFETLRRLDMERSSSEPPEKAINPKRKTLSSGNDDKKRRKSEKDIKVITADKITTEKRKLSKSGETLNPTPQQLFTKVFNKDNSQLEDGVSAEPYQGLYYKLRANDHKTPEVKQSLLNLGASMGNNQITRNIDIVSFDSYQSMKFSNVILPNHQQHSEKGEAGKKTKHNETSIEVKSYSDNPKQRYVGVPKTGVFISDRMGRSEQKVLIPKGTPVIEYLGEIDYFELYATTKVNQYDTWGTLKPKVVKVDLPISSNATSSFVLDSRFVGNESRFIRKSCIHTANCEVKPIYIPELNTFKFVVFTSKSIVLSDENVEEELRLPWQWDFHHPIQKMIIETEVGKFEEGEKFEDFSDDEKVLLVSGVDKILNFVECACNTTSMSPMCPIFKVKKATSYLLRSTRKASSLSLTSFHKSKEELVMPRKNKKFISWKERLLERDQAINLDLLREFSGRSESIDEKSLHASEFSNDEDSSSHSIKRMIDDSISNLPFKRRIFAQGRRYASKKFRFESGTSENYDEANITISIPKTIAVPLMNEILCTIKDTVKGRLHPNVNPATLNTVKKEHFSADTSSLTPSQKDESPVPLTTTVETKADIAVKPPPAVKKLSFADYKKKMK